MFSPKYLVFGLSGLTVASGGIAAWWFTKNNKKIDKDQAEKDKLFKKIQNECGESLDDEWYEEKEEGFEPIFFYTDGNRIQREKNKNVSLDKIDKTKGYYKQNSKHKDADSYSTCSNNIISKFAPPMNDSTS